MNLRPEGVNLTFPGQVNVNVGGPQEKTAINHIGQLLNAYLSNITTTDLNIFLQTINRL